MFVLLTHASRCFLSKPSNNAKSVSGKCLAGSGHISRSPYRMYLKLANTYVSASCEKGNIGCMGMNLCLLFHVWTENAIEQWDAGHYIGSFQMDC